MAQLKDLIVAGASRFIGDVYANKAQLTSLLAPTSAGGTAYGAGTNGNILRTNGTSLYWGTLAAGDVPNLDASKITSGTLPVNRGGTGATTFTSGEVLIGNGTSAIGTKAILNNTSKSAVGWNSNGASHADNLRLINVNTLSYWNGAWSGTSSNLSILGTVTTGTWNGSTIGTAYGGTGNTTFTANRLVWSESATKLTASYHYANSTKVAINSTSEPTQNFYVSGTSYFYHSSGSSSRPIISGTRTDKHLSIGNAGFQTYNNDSASVLYLNYYGGQVDIGSTDTASATRNFYGTFDFKSSNGFTYSGIGTASDNVARPVWFSYNGITGRPVYDNDFKYNPSTNTLTVGSITGNAATATALTSNAGAADKPIYFSSGKPSAITKTAGSATKGAYFDAGTIKEMTYSLSSTVNSGTANKLAYYSGANAISSSSITVDSANGDIVAPRYVYANYFNASCAAETPSTSSYWIYADGSGWLRKSSLSNVNKLLSPYEEKLQWGPSTVNIIGGVSPIGMSLSDEHSCNRLAFINGNSLTMEYSSDGGSTWNDYGYSASDKSKLCTLSFSIPIGRTSGNYTTSSRTRITLTAQGYVYTNPKKMLINISSSGSMEVLIEYRTGTNYQNNGTWATYGTYSLSGWSGWNDIPLILETLGGGSTQTSNIWQLRLTFIMKSVSTDYQTVAHVNAIRLFGENGWGTTSNLGSIGHLYSYDMSQNATFPAQITATQFNGPLSGNATTATTATYLAGFTNTTTTATAINNATQNGHVYVSGTSGIYNQNDGAAFVQAYSTSWVAQIYQDYRSGQIAVRSKNNGTWQAWRKVLDSTNYTDYTVKKDGTGASGSWGISITGNAATASAVAWANVTGKPNGTATPLMDGTAAVGTATLYSREDHVHPTDTSRMSATNPTGTGYFSLNRKAYTTIGDYSFAEGSDTTASGNRSHAEGYYTIARSGNSHAEGYYTEASGGSSHAEGAHTEASGDYSHAEGNYTQSTEVASHAEGYNTTASGYQGSHAEGSETTASGNYGSHAEGLRTTASYQASHAEGSDTTASGASSHAEGIDTTASGASSHAEGDGTTASGVASHAEGGGTEASGNYSHVEGFYTEASGSCSHAGGFYTTASANYQTAIGKFNIDSNDNTATGFAFLVGNGTAADARSNAFDVRWNGNAGNQGSYWVGDSLYIHNQTGTKKRVEPTGLTVNSDGYPAVSVRTATNTNLISSPFSLPAGTWVLTGTASFASNATGRRAVWFSTSSAGSSLGLRFQNVKMAVNGAATLVHVTCILTVSSATPIYFVGYQNSGSNLNVTPRIAYFGNAS